MSEGEGRLLEEKENVGWVLLVAERIAADGQKPVTRKRRHEEEDGEDCLGWMVLLRLRSSSRVG